MSSNIHNLYGGLAFFMSDKNERKRLVKRFKVFIAAHHYAFISKDIEEIAAAANVSPERIKRWMDTGEWRVSLTFFGENATHVGEITKGGDFAFAMRTWKQLVKFDEHVDPSDYPDSHIFVGNKIYL